MTVKAALRCAALATFGFILTAETSLSATQTLTGFAGLSDDRAEVNLDSCCQDFGVLPFQGGVPDVSGAGDGTATDSLGRRAADTAAQKPAPLPDDLVDVAPASGASANAALAFGGETGSDSTASSRLGDSEADTSVSAGAADVAASSSWTQILARIVEFSANATGRSAAP